jgi:hypothetical protein
MQGTFVFLAARLRRHSVVTRITIGDNLTERAVAGNGARLLAEWERDVLGWPASLHRPRGHGIVGGLISFMGFG